MHVDIRLFKNYAKINKDMFKKRTEKEAVGRDGTLTQRCVKVPPLRIIVSPELSPSSPRKELWPPKPHKWAEKHQTDPSLIECVHLSFFFTISSNRRTIGCTSRRTTFWSCGGEDTEQSVIHCVIFSQNGPSFSLTAIALYSSSSLLDFGKMVTKLDK